MSALESAQVRDLVTDSLRIYEERWRAKLEAQYLGAIIAIEPESGDYVLGKTFSECVENCRKQFGTKRTHMFRVGGGGAVKIGGAYVSRWIRG